MDVCEQPLGDALDEQALSSVSTGSGLVRRSNTASSSSLNPSTTPRCSSAESSRESAISRRITSSMFSEPAL